jgi:catechol 2,3-dioxygenase-like lactoylglutathione lyase family enzyme
MNVIGINHINIRTTDVAASARFYVDVFGFEFRQEPGMLGIQRNWLFDKNGRPVIHFRVVESALNSSGSVDHLALDCEGKAEVLQRLRARHLDVSVYENIQPGVTRVFVKDPHGLTLELYFDGE